MAIIFFKRGKDRKLGLVIYYNPSQSILLMKVADKLILHKKISFSTSMIKVKWCNSWHTPVTFRVYYPNYVLAAL
jgi:hypothetical protein